MRSSTIGAKPEARSDQSCNLSYLSAAMSPNVIIGSTVERITTLVGIYDLLRMQASQL